MEKRSSSQDFRSLSLSLDSSVIQLCQLQLQPPPNALLQSTSSSKSNSVILSLN